MYDELTEVDIQKMKDEIDYRTRELRPKLIEEVKVARGFGDLSENFEYKAAKREKNRNDSRIRYLQRMVDTAKVISDHSSGDVVGLFDKVVIYIPDDDEEQTIRLVTTLRQNALEGLISTFREIVMFSSVFIVVHVLMFITCFEYFQHIAPRVVLETCVPFYRCTV